jgi:hypothetical protein
VVEHIRKAKLKQTTMLTTDQAQFRLHISNGLSPSAKRDQLCADKGLDVKSTEIIVAYYDSGIQRQQVGLDHIIPPPIDRRENVLEQVPDQMKPGQLLNHEVDPSHSSLLRSTMLPFWIVSEAHLLYEGRRRLQPS